MPEIWRKNYTEYPTLDRDIKCGAAVVGGGLTGALLAYMLAERGIDTVLFESGRIALGKTGRSTAKVTVAHKMIYTELAEKMSPAVSRKYAAANLAGMKRLSELIPPENKRDMYLYALYGERRIRKEFMHMRENGIDCEYVEGSDCPLPFETAGAVKLPEQYAIDPVILVESLCREGHFKVYENSPAERIEMHGFDCLGHRVRSDFVAVCTNYPVHVPSSGAPLKLCRKASAAVVMESDDGFPMADIIAFGADGGYGYRYADGNSNRLIVSGETGRILPPNAEERLSSAVRKFAPNARIFETWVNNDTYTHDGIPYAGRLKSGIFTACGYSAWGMTNSASAAVILENQICGRNLWYDDIFSPSRNFMTGGSGEFSEYISTAVGGMMKNISTPPDKYAAEVHEGEAAVVNCRGKRVGAYRDDDGVVHLVSLKCPHLGCSLEWNPVEKTWDCPCHGSRFSYTGTCISNPAEHGIAID